ncbi:MAG: nuclear transport factor 2 family protein [Phycisphaeraceae bacterium]|nr:nuclear transport factor 2 family protein [Phycisphaeraceae bacterium]
MADDVLSVGRELVKLCQEGRHLEAIERLYDPAIVSTEVCGDETMPARMEGIEAIKGKNAWFLENHEIHGGELRGPFPHGQQFAVYSVMEVTAKVGPMAGKRMKLEEVALYTVASGKIVEERFFYDMSDMGG